MHEDVEMSFGDHLDELRRRVIYAVLGLVAAAAFCGFNYDFLLKALMRPYSRAYKNLIASKLDTDKPEEPPGGNVGRPPLDIPADSPLASVLKAIDKRLAGLEKRLDVIAPEPEAGPEASEDSIAYAQRFPAPRVIQGGPLTGYVTAILLCVICGIILASPWILYQVWAFIGVGLYPHERRHVHVYGPFSFFLFVAGAATFYFIMLPTALGALMAPTAGILVDGMPIIDPSFFLNDYFKFVAMMTLIFGVVFQTPLVVMFIAWTEIISLDTLVRKQKIVILVLAVASAVLTPQDPVTMVMMAIPLIILYWFGLLLAWVSLRRKHKHAAEGGEHDDWWGAGDGAAPSDTPDDERPEGAADIATTEDATGADTDTHADADAEPSADEDPYAYPEDDQYEYEREYGQYDDEDLYGYDDESEGVGTDEDAHPDEEPAQETGDETAQTTEDESNGTADAQDYGYPPGRDPYEDEHEGDGYGDGDGPDAYEPPTDQAEPDAEAPAEPERNEPDTDQADDGDPDDDQADDANPDDAETGPDDRLPPEDRMK